MSGVQGQPMEHSHDILIRSLILTVFSFIETIVKISFMAIARSRSEKLAQTRYLSFAKLCDGRNRSRRSALLSLGPSAGNMKYDRSHHLLTRFASYIAKQYRQSLCKRLAHFHMLRDQSHLTIV